MLESFIADALSEIKPGDTCALSGRISKRRHHGRLTFYELTDHTATVQLVLEKGSIGLYDTLSNITEGSYVAVNGTLMNGRHSPEINVENIQVLGSASLHLSPNPWEINGSDPQFGKQVFGFPGIFVANQQRLSILKIKTNFIASLHEYFQRRRFTLVDPPILTNKTLYNNSTAVRAEVHGEAVYLSQCATFELEALALALGKVYTISSAFRNEPTGSKRHLAEYTHAKAEVLLANIDDLMLLASDAISQSLQITVETSSRELKELGVEIDTQAIEPARQVRMTYDEAIRIVSSRGSSTPYGSGLKRNDEILLTEHVGNRYLWVMFPPFESEGFPYKRVPGNPHLSLTCDLIAPHGAGEMVGVAEKITDAEELIVNLIEKGKLGEIHNYWDYIQLREYGMPPHGGLGAAPERIIYGLLGLDHIRLTKPWPRYPDRKINPIPNESLDTHGSPELERLVKKYRLQ